MKNSLIIAAFVNIYINFQQSISNLFLVMNFCLSEQRFYLKINIFNRMHKTDTKKCVEM